MQGFPENMAQPWKTNGQTLFSQSWMTTTDREAPLKKTETRNRGIEMGRRHQQPHRSRNRSHRQHRPRAIWLARSPTHTTLLPFAAPHTAPGVSLEARPDSRHRCLRRGNGDSQGGGAVNMAHQGRCCGASTSRRWGRCAVTLYSQHHGAALMTAPRAKRLRLPARPRKTRRSMNATS